MRKKSTFAAPLTRDSILRAAVRHADSYGIESLSMRELGRALGVEAMSLYNHIANKDTLLDGMVDAVLDEIPLPAPDTPWREAMRARAFAARAAFMRHQWAPGLIDTRVSGGPRRLHYFNAILGTLRRAGFPIDLASRAFSLLDSFIYGFCRQNIARPEEEAENSPAAEAFLRTLPIKEYVYVAEMAERYAAGPAYDTDADFRFGLDLILDGLQRILDSND